MIITKSDIGRKAVARNGSEWIISLPDRSSYFYPFLATNVDNGAEMDVPINGRFFDNNNDSRHDLIRWADETEDSQ